jgi:hypothetical protein
MHTFLTLPVLRRGSKDELQICQDESTALRIRPALGFGIGVWAVATSVNSVLSGGSLQQREGQTDYSVN